jgi:hypothetical protein
VFVVHVRHEDTKFELRESAKHLLDFWEADRLLGSPQRLRQGNGAGLRYICDLHVGILD